MNTKIIKTVVLVGLTSLFILSSCKSEDESPSSNTQKQIQGIVEKGDWRITKFIESETDETDYFSDFTFTFNSSGVLSAQDESINYNGTWLVSDDHSGDDDDDSDDNLHFTIQFDLTNNFEDLNDDWHILSHSSTKIELIDVSGGDGGTDYLTFEKI